MANALWLSAAATAFTFLAIISTSFANAPLIFIWLALARNAECQRNARRLRESSVLEIEESPHGNLGREIIGRQANTMNDRKSVMHKIQAHGPKALLRLFKITRPIFDDVVDKIKPIVEVGKFGKEQARRSSSSHVPTLLQLVASLWWLASANHMCQQDNFGLSKTEFYKS